MKLQLYFSKIKDSRRLQGQRYVLSYVLLFVVFSLLSNANSYRMIETYIGTNLKTFKKLFKIKWKSAPTYVQIRNILIGLSQHELESAFRAYSKHILEEKVQKGKKRLYVAIDGKTLRGSISRFEEQKALHQISAYDIKEDIILGHIDVKEKSNEIEAVQRLLGQLNLNEVLYTMDAMHCQKKLCK